MILNDIYIFQQFLKEFEEVKGDFPNQNFIGLLSRHDNSAQKQPPDVFFKESSS